MLPAFSQTVSSQPRPSQCQVYTSSQLLGVREGKNFVHSQDRGPATGVSIARVQLSCLCALLLGSRVLGAHNPHPTPRRQGLKYLMKGYGRKVFK